MDIKTVWEPAQAYVMLSRVQSIEQLFIVGELPQEKIYTKKSAEDELKSGNQKQGRQLKLQH